jgi:hypothetical protein
LDPWSETHAAMAAGAVDSNERTMPLVLGRPEPLVLIDRVCRIGPSILTDRCLFVPVVTGEPLLSGQLAQFSFRGRPVTAVSRS